MELIVGSVRQNASPSSFHFNEIFFGEIIEKLETPYNSKNHVVFRVFQAFFKWSNDIVFILSFTCHALLRSPSSTIPTSIQNSRLFVLPSFGGDGGHLLKQATGRSL